VPEHFCTAGVHGVFFADQLRAVAAVLRRVAAGERYDEVSGGCFPGGAGGWRRNPSAPLDPAALPIPRRVLLAQQPERYFYMYYQRCASVKTAFGCTERCSFCFCTRQHGGRYGPRPMEQVVEEIAGLPVRNVFLLDDNFLSSPARVREFCRRMDERGLDKQLIAYGSASFAVAHPELMAELRRIGLTGLIVGFESLDDDELAEMNKSSSAADNERCLELCRELDIEVFALFIVQPHWEPARFRALARYLRERAIAFATFATATALPGTDPEASPPPLGPGAGGWWRHDLLRLHETPRHMSRLGFYLRLLWLYTVPFLSARARRTQLRRYGWRRLLRFALLGWWSGLEFLVKILVWR